MFFSTLKESSKLRRSIVLFQEHQEYSRSLASYGGRGRNYKSERLSPSPDDPPRPISPV